MLIEWLIQKTRSGCGRSTARPLLLPSAATGATAAAQAEAAAPAFSLHRSEKLSNLLNLSFLIGLEIECLSKLGTGETNKMTTAAC